MLEKLRSPLHVTNLILIVTCSTSYRFMDGQYTGFDGAVTVINSERDRLTGANRSS